MILDTYLLNAQRYKVRIKGKVEQFREKKYHPPLHLDAVAVEKRAFWSPSNIVANFTYFYIYISGDTSLFLLLVPPRPLSTSVPNPWSVDSN